MKKRFWLYKRGSVYYIQDSLTGKQQSLETKSQLDAERLLHAKLESVQQPILNLQLGKAYLSAYDPQMPERTWGMVMEKAKSRGKEQTVARWQRAIKSESFDSIRNKKLIETTADDFYQVLKSGTVSTHSYLRILQNFALGLGWLPWPIIPQRLWPQAKYKIKRAITLDEHQTIIDAEKNLERRLFYELLWNIGASQTDAVMLKANNIDWNSRILAYQRQKTGTWAYLSIGKKLESILRRLPEKGPLFPNLSKTKDTDRASEFYRRCKLCGIRGISLHSYRYSWAERAKTAGYPERFAQEALGHNSKAVHRAYSKQARVKLPSLEDYENNIATSNIVEGDFNNTTNNISNTQTFHSEDETETRILS